MILLPLQNCKKQKKEDIKMIFSRDIYKKRFTQMRDNLIAI